jgi:hypothetical protein
MTQSQRRPRKTKAQWQAILAVFHQSDLSASAYCQEQGLAYGTFAKWRQRLAQVAHPEKTAELIELISPASVAESKSGNWQVELELGNGMTLRVSAA